LDTAQSLQALDELSPHSLAHDFRMQPSCAKSALAVGHELAMHFCQQGALK
jgi:hypothetical protein